LKEEKGDGRHRMCPLGRVMGPLQAFAEKKKIPSPCLRNVKGEEEGGKVENVYRVRGCSGEGNTQNELSITGRKRKKRNTK